jgi:UTP--glucose-1-phosphate uridylyltransferase
MKINKAVVAVAGFGTRSLPVTKTIQKEMFPVINRPVVDYLVDDLVKAGIREIIFVTNDHNQQIFHYYRENKRLERYLEKMNKANLYDEVRDLHKKAQFHFVNQTEENGYGTAVPVKLAQKHLENEEAFIVLMGDDIPYNSDGKSETKRMIETLNSSGADALATFVEQNEDQLHRYGIASVKEKNGQKYLKDLVEKPELGTAPSNLANISNYILNPAIFKIIDGQEPNKKSGELYITDTVAKLAKKQEVLVHIPDGKYLDAGYPLGWLKANLTMAKDIPEFRTELKKYLEEIDF